MTTTMLAPPVRRSAGDDIRALPTVLRSEWIKLSSLRSSRAMLGLTTVVGGFTSWAVATLVTDEVMTVSRDATYSTVLTAVFAAVMGVLIFTSEAQHGTLTTSLTARPARWMIALAKALMAAGVGLVLGAVGLGASIAAAKLSGMAPGDSSTLPATVLWSLLFTSLAAVLGLGVGMVARNSSAAISGLLVWWLVVESLLNLFLPVRVSRFLPFLSGNVLLGIESEFATPESIAVAFGRGQAALVFGSYTAAALVAGTVLLYRRDTN